MKVYEIFFKSKSAPQSLILKDDQLFILWTFGEYYILDQFIIEDNHIRWIKTFPKEVMTPSKEMEDTVNHFWIKFNPEMYKEIHIEQFLTHQNKELRELVKNIV